MQLIKLLGTRVSKSNYKESWAVFWCDFCKQEVEKKLSDGKRAKSCGCVQYELIAKSQKGVIKNVKHGETKTKLYGIWHSMKQRILNPKSQAYKDYGGRGITICPEWTNDYIAFRDWAGNNGYKEDLFIDRRNPNGNYEPSNCRFLTILESNRNKTNTITMEIANEIRALYVTGNYTQEKLAKKFNILIATVSFIINNKTWRKNASK